jgi:serine/threonine-protein kinase
VTAASAGAGPRTLGRYELIASIGSGGMAEVHLARQRGPMGFEKLVVVKTIHQQLASKRAFIDMLLEEARVAALVKHANVVDIYDLGEAGGEYFIAMEYLEGEPLLSLLYAGKQGQRLDVLSTARMIADSARGLHAAHEHHGMSGQPMTLIHHDVSPGNIVILFTGEVKLVDFGVAKAEDAVTEGGAPVILKGKVGYMAPEQLAHEGVDRRTDLYAAAVVLWETLTGRRLFKADNLSALIVKVMADPVEVPSTYADGIPSDIDMILMKALSRDVRDRWTTARELAVLLEGALPPAPARDVGAWVEEVGGDRLRYRAEVVAAIEAQSIAHLKVPSAARSLGRITVESASSDLTGLDADALPGAVEQALASDPQIKAVMLRRSQPLFGAEPSTSRLPQLQAGRANPCAPERGQEPPPGAQATLGAAPVAPVAPVAPAPFAPVVDTPAPTPPRPQPARAAKRGLSSGARSALLALGVLVLIVCAAYAGLTLGRIDPP